ncbi:molybdenum cofactor biosynthesis protein [Lentinula edodes]|uniref:Molybdenum cofactor biosynthesis protein n=1 Tax=Lentinula edodes TaxID=5353 RepID=A0A1Q3EGT5_LENED|nr:molybdenum cofactor biosynthesis protein [Lentinula edodes]
MVISCCHCSNCKKYTGTAFSTNVIFPGGALTFMKGENLLSTYKDAAQDSGNAIKRVFCSKCGSPLYNEGGDDAKIVSVFYSALIDFATRDEKNRKPELEFYTKDRLEWRYVAKDRFIVTLMPTVLFFAIHWRYCSRAEFTPTMSNEDPAMKIRVAVLTVSDRGSAANSDPTYDKSGPAIQEMLAAYPAFLCTDHAIVPDDIQTIQDAVRKWVDDEETDWIITTGGTGFGPKDRTPEAVTPLLTRPAPGLVHLLLSSGLRHTPMAALSRPVAGTIARRSSSMNSDRDVSSVSESGHETLIVTLPGSLKAAGMEVGVVKVCMAPWNPNLHTGMGMDTGIMEVIVMTMTMIMEIDVEEDLFTVKALTITIITTEIIGFYRMIHPKLYPHAIEHHHYPPTKTTSVDGYALRASDPAGSYTVLTSSSHPHLLSPTSTEELPEGCIYRINTGGALSRGADTVIMVEDTKLVATYPEAPSSDDTTGGQPGEEWKVETLIPAPPSRFNIRQPGSDVRQGDLVMRKGERITSGGGEIGSLIFIGKKEVKVFKKPIVALMSTGNEIRDILGSISSGNGEGDWKSWDTNRPSLTAALEGMGYEVLDLGIVPDEIDAHVQALQDGLARADIILTTGGTSMGPTDLLKPVIERKLGGEVKFGRVSIKPGKPTTFAIIPVDASNNASGDTSKMFKPLFALPGNPASALVTFNVFVVPALRKLGGWEFSGVGCQLPRVRVELQQSMLLDPRTEFHRVILRSGLEEGWKLKAYSTGGQRSSRVASLSGANGLIILPQKGTGDKDELKNGETAEAIVIGEILN